MNDEIIRTLKISSVFWVVEGKVYGQIYKIKLKLSV